MPYPFYHSNVKPTDYIVCSTGTRRNFVFDADRVGSSTRILFGYNGGPVLETWTRRDGSFNLLVPDVGPLHDTALGGQQEIGTWRFQFDPWTITSQQAAPTAFDHTPSWTNTFTGFYQVRPTDIDISCVVKAASGRAGLFMRGDNNPTLSNGYYLDIAAGFVKFSTTVTNNTMGTTVFTGTTPIVANTNYTLRLVAVGNTYTVYVNGAQEGTFTSSVTNGGFAGIFADTTTARFSNPFTIAKSTNPIATTYTVRNYDGVIVATGSVTDDHVDIPDSSLTWRGRGPYGWYRFYLTGPDHGAPWGTAYGDCSFYRVRTDSGFYANAPNMYLATGSSPANDEYARATMGGLGPIRFAMSVSTSGTPAANNADVAIAAPFYKTNWVDVAPSLRPRLNLGAFGESPVTHDPAVITPTVALLKDSIQAWEPRNEPYYGGPTPGESYITQEFDPFRTAVKAGDTNAKVFGPGPVTFNNSDSGGYLNFISSFLTACMTRGGTAYLDGLSVHAYNCFNGDLSLGRTSLVALKAVITARGYTGPLYQTEQGFDWQYFGVTQPRHGARWTALMWFLCELYGIPTDNNSFWYDQNHGFSSVPDWWLDTVGPGPQALPLRTMQAEIGNRTLTSQFDFGTNANHLYAGGTWTAGDGTKTVGFIAGSVGLSDLTLTVSGASSVTACDAWGNTYSLTVTAGQTTLTVSELPIWVRCPAGVSVVPASVGFDTNLATAATVTVTGDQNRLTRVNDGTISNQYGDSTASLSASSAPYSDTSGTFPQTVTLSFPSPVTANRIVVHSFPPWQKQGTLTDFDVDTFDGSAWTTRYSHPLPASQTFAFTSIARCYYDTYWDQRHIFDVSFTAVSITKVRVVVRACSYGEFDTPTIVTDLWASDPTMGVLTQYLEIRDLQVFNVPAPPSPGVPRLRNPAMGGVTG